MHVNQDVILVIKRSRSRPDWVLDVSMQEDACQIYKDHAAENLACLRHLALNMLRAEPTKLSIVGKQKRCWMKTEHLEKVLIAGLSMPLKN